MALYFKGSDPNVCSQLTQTIDQLASRIAELEAALATQNK